MDLQMVGKGRGSHGERLDVGRAMAEIPELFIRLNWDIGSKQGDCLCKKRFYQNNSYYY